MVRPLWPNFRLKFWWEYQFLLNVCLYIYIYMCVCDQKVFMKKVLLNIMEKEHLIDSTCFFTRERMKGLMKSQWSFPPDWSAFNHSLVIVKNKYETWELLSLYKLKCWTVFSTSLLNSSELQFVQRQQSSSFILALNSVQRMVKHLRRVSTFPYLYMFNVKLNIYCSSYSKRLFSTYTYSRMIRVSVKKYKLWLETCWLGSLLDKIISNSMVFVMSFFCR